MIPSYSPKGKTRRFSGLDADVVIEKLGLGMNANQCTLCFEIFSTERNGVQHRVESRVGRYPGAYIQGECIDPATKGMMLSHRGVWKMAPKESGDYSSLKEKK